MNHDSHFIAIPDDSVAIATAMETTDMVGKTSIAIQANDYEIERRSGILPARRRIIPFKFRCAYIVWLSDAFRREEHDIVVCTLQWYILLSIARISTCRHWSVCVDLWYMHLKQKFRQYPLCKDASAKSWPPRLKETEGHRKAFTRRTQLPYNQKRRNYSIYFKNSQYIRSCLYAIYSFCCWLFWCSHPCVFWILHHLIIITVLSIWHNFIQNILL